ncbi:hypothetical protein N0V83_003908 [Neocucurbitaria cava]|uniref:Uncharacterized protein n=1 Tax=Neocucurbitaria cava TaxID=798079 RepID=A0A9W8YAK5_9PLEO|nr:hypothetical protein N0V83_003908 [Neocucurbitaria cava]
MSALFGATYFLPVYFQAVKGVKAITSGVYPLSMILPQMLLVIIAGATVNRLGYIPSFAITSGALTAVGPGLFSLFRPDTPTGEWVGSMVLTGVGGGLGIMMPSLFGPNILDLRSFLSLYNVIFDTSLRSQLRAKAPNANPQAIINAGATHFRYIVDDGDLPGVLVAYSNSIDHVFYLTAALAGVASITGWGMSWKKISKKEKEDLESTEMPDTEARSAEDDSTRNAKNKLG